MTNEKVCPMCEEGELRPSTYTGQLEHNGQRILVPDLECHVCDTCGADPVLQDQTRRNQRRYADVRRKADGLLTGDEIRDIREALSLTQHEAALLFGGGANAFSKYERGDVVQSVAMDRLIKVIAAHPFLLCWLHELAGLASCRDVDYLYSEESAVSMNDPNYQQHSMRRVRLGVVVSSNDYADSKQAA